MSGRGGGRNPREQPPGRGGGRGGGRGPPGGDGGRGGRGGRGSAPVPNVTQASPSPASGPPQAFPSLVPSTKPNQAFPSLAPSTKAIATPSASTSGPVESLSRDVGNLTLHPAPAPAPVVRPPPSSSKAMTLPLRPGFGKIGRKCVIRANHFLVQVADRDLHHYDVSISPEITSKRLNRLVISQLVKEYRQSHLGGRIPAYDGSKSLYTAGNLPFESKEFVIKYIDEEAAPTSSRRERVFKVAIKFAAKADLHHLQQFLSARQLDAPQETLQALDVVLRATPAEKYITVGRSFFSLQLGKPGDLGDGLEFWRGYYQSLRPTQMGLSLNIDVSARSFYDPIPVIDFVNKHMRLRDMNRPMSDQDRVKLKRALRGIKVQLRHLEHVRMYKITGVSSKPLSQLTFRLEEENRDVSVVQYYLEKYKITLKNVALPAIQAGSDSKPSYLPMELCWIMEGQRYTKKLNERQVTNLLRATCQRPRDRENLIKEMVKQNNYVTDARVSKEFGIQVGLELKLVDARVLPPPMLKYHGNGQDSVVGPNTGAWNMMKYKMVNGGTVDCWTCVNFSRVHPDAPFDFCHALVDMCRRKGINFKQDPIIPIQSFQPNRIEKVLCDIHRQCEALLGPQKKYLQLLIIILPDVSGSYPMIKTICETELGIVSQCCQPKQVVKMNAQYLENLSLKINVKVGGRNNVLHDAILRKIPHVSDCPTIIFGADVTHPSPGEDSSPSIAAVVASMDWPEITKYRGLVSAQRHRDEIIEDLYKTVKDPQRGIVSGGMIRELLMAFRRSTGHKPLRIIFYRDGVSEGQFNQVLLYEIDAIRKACQSLEEGYLPPITFVVVQKRHHTRFFPADHNKRDSTDRSGNILPGTVVDTSICHPTQFDFYLNSHAGIQGTSRPAHYHVLYDENRFSADELQTLTNNLCYTYVRCTRSVSIVPPAYYAHLAAFRARYYIEGVYSSDGGSTSAGGKNTRDQNVEVKPLPVIKANVQNVMFYC